jgi:dolichol-phosphate mannosyltransferase
MNKDKLMVPDFEVNEFSIKKNSYCLLIPIINEGERIINQLKRAKNANIHDFCDIIICDGNSTDGSLEQELLKSLNVNTILVKKSSGKQSAQLRMGFYWALNRGYDGFITIDGNNKDSIENVPNFIDALQENYDFVQGSRYIKGGKAINTPLLRSLSVRLIHAPIISLSAKYKFTDSTNGFRAYSKKYITHPDLQPFRSVFQTYELLAYLSVRATQLGLRVKELPVTRAYPKIGKTPTKISPIRGNFKLFSILFKNLFRVYHPKKRDYK